MEERMTVKLESNEMAALKLFAESELRDFRQQAAVIIRLDLERRGFLPESELSDDLGGMLVILNQVIPSEESCDE